MTKGEKTIHFKGEELMLLPQKAMYMSKVNALLVADLHLGKLTHFRKSGIGLPDHGEANNLEILANMLSEYQPHTCYFMGDLFHSKYNSMWEYLMDFLKIYTDIDFVLVEGNHDILSSRLYDKAGLTLKEEVKVGPFLLTHEPVEPEDDYYNLCGHIHPGVTLRGKARQSLRLPCFYFGQKQGILPAFGSFTGLAMVTPKKNDQVYVIANDQVIEISRKK